MKELTVDHLLDLYLANDTNSLLDALERESIRKKKTKSSIPRTPSEESVWYSDPTDDENFWWDEKLTKEQAIAAGWTPDQEVPQDVFGSPLPTAPVLTDEEVGLDPASTSRPTTAPRLTDEDIIAAGYRRAPHGGWVFDQQQEDERREDLATARREFQARQAARRCPPIQESAELVMKTLHKVS